MTDRHKDNPIPYRPSAGNREWLQAQKNAGTVINAIINKAIEAYRRLTEGEQS